MTEIFVVEDDPGMGIVLRMNLKRLLDRFTGSVLVIARTYGEVRERLLRYPPPDFIILDLNLPDSNMEETLSHYEELQEHSAVVIVTGQSKEKVMALLRNPEKAEVISKTAGGLDGNMLIAACARALNWKRERDTQRAMDNINVMHELLGAPDDTPDDAPPPRPQ